jgi:hypothetical protein
MEDNFQPEDHQFIHEMARKADSQRQEENRKRMLVEHNEAKIQKRQAALETKKRNALQKAGRIAAVTLIFDKEEVAKLKGEKLKDHLLAFKQAGAPGLQGITTRSTVGQIRQALQSAIGSFNNGDWEPLQQSEGENSSEEENLQDDSDWEDI